MALSSADSKKSGGSGKTHVPVNSFQNLVAFSGKLKALLRPHSNPREQNILFSWFIIADSTQLLPSFWSSESL
jgi:hypothetical protein